MKDVLAYLRLVHNPRDAVAFRRVVNVPSRGIGAKTVEEIERAAGAGGESPWEATARLLDDAALPARALSPLRRFRDTVESLRAEAPARGLRALIERVLELSGYGAALAHEDSQESQERLENLAELLSAAAARSSARFSSRSWLSCESSRARADP